MNCSIDRLKKEQDAIKLVRFLKDEGFDAFFVGGCVRDCLIDRDYHDIDICTNAKPREIIDILDKHGIYHLDLGEKFGSIVAEVRGRSYDITTFRSEGLYSDMRHPDDVVFEDNIYKDLNRRDFTINAIAYDPLADVLIYSGLAFSDLDNRMIICEGDVYSKFKDDPLRMLRALRFAITLGFDIGGIEKEEIHNNFHLLKNVSKERITAEITEMLISNKPIFNIFNEFADVISFLIPEITPCIGMSQNNKYHKHDVYQHLLSVTDACDSTNFNVKMAALLHDIGKPQSYTEDEKGNGHFYGHPEVSADIAQEVLTTRFRLPKSYIVQIVDLIRYHDLRPVNTDKSVRKLLNKMSEDTLEKWFTLKYADVSDHTSIATFYSDLPNIYRRFKILIEKENCFKIKDLEISGHDIMRIIGVEQGKDVGDILDYIFFAVQEGYIGNNIDEQIELVKKTFCKE